MSVGLLFGGPPISRQRCPYFVGSCPAAARLFHSVLPCGTCSTCGCPVNADSLPFLPFQFGQFRLIWEIGSSSPLSSPLSVTSRPSAKFVAM